MIKEKKNLEQFDTAMEKEKKFLFRQIPSIIELIASGAKYATVD
jgi:hypothetical protein